MRKKLNNIELNVFDKILSKILKRYTYKIYSIGVKDGYNWRSNLYKKKKKENMLLIYYSFCSIIIRIC